MKTNIVKIYHWRRYTIPVLIIAGIAVAGTTFFLRTQAAECGGPITITTGGTYSGCWESNSQGVAVTIATNQPVEIRNSVIRGTGDLIRTSVGNSKVGIINSTLLGLYPGGKGNSPGYTAWMDSFDWFVFEHNHIEQKGGLKLNKWAGYGNPRPVLIRYNTVSNLDGRVTDGIGGYSGNTFTQFVQFDGVKNASGIEIAWNQIINTANQSANEDVISMYDSSGTATAPIDIHDNYIQGAYPFPATAAAYSGGGIMLGDGGGYWQQARDNQVIGTTNYGIAISGGQNMSLINNRVIGSGRLADGTILQATNIGMYVWNQYSAPFGNAQAYGNVIGWFKATTGSRNDYWLPNCTGNCGNSSLQTSDNQISVADEQNEYPRWLSKLRSSGMVIGPDSNGTPALTGFSPQNGSISGKTIVTISGSGFRANAQVTFGDAVATISSQTDTRIVVTAPAHAIGAVPVTVTNSDGRKATSAGVYNYAASADINGDNRVNALDLSVVLAHDNQNYQPADLNGDGTVGAADLAILIAKWTW